MHWWGPRSLVDRVGVARSSCVDDLQSIRPARAARRTLEPTHPCIRCGREGVPADAGLCELCNPLELSQPSATQMHGIAAVGILVFVVVLAVAGRAVIAGTGPFGGAVVGVAPAAGGLAVTLEVANEGSQAASTTCYVSETPTPIGGPQAAGPGAARPARRERSGSRRPSTRFGTRPIALAVDCPAP